MIQTALVILILTATLFFTARWIVRQLRDKGAGCGCGCSDCPKARQRKAMNCHCGTELPKQTGDSDLA